MSIYNPPTQDLPIFNPIYWDTSANSSDNYLTSAEANSTYAKLSGNQTIIGFETFSGGVKTETLQSITAGNSISISESVDLASTKSYKINNADVLSATSLGSSVVNSSLTGIGTLASGCNVATGQTYKINNTSVLSATSLGSSVVNSSLTSVGTQTAGVNIASGQSYKVNNVAVLSATSLGSSVIDSALKSIGTLETSTVYYQQTVSGTTTNPTVTANNINIQLQTSVQRFLQHQSYSITFPSGTTAFSLNFTRTTGFVQYSLRNQNYTYYSNGFITLLGTTVNSVGTTQKSTNMNTPTLSISTISGSSLPAINFTLATTLSGATNNAFTITMYYQTE